MQRIQKIAFICMLFSCAAFTNLKASNEPIIVAQPASIALHSGAQAALKVQVVETLTVVYQWQKSYDNTNWLSIQGANKATYTPQTQETGKAWYRVLVTTVEENARAVASQSAEVTIRDTPNTELSIKK